jgi:prepilin-type processing-associated H-X9-DG protein
MNAIDASYGFFGYVLDRIDEVYGTSDASTIPMLNANGPGPKQAVDTLAKIVTEMASNYPATNNPVKANLMNAVTTKNVGVTQGVGNGGGDTVYHFKEGIERFLITDINNPAGANIAQSSTFVMWDRVSKNPEDFNHVPGGANVLYMDGHVEFIKYPGKSPLTPLFAAFDQIVNEGN